MARREIVLLGDPVLRREAAPVEEFDDELRALARDMFDTMYRAEGIGLAAPQVGISKRLLVIDLRRDEGVDERFVLVNPEITWSSDEMDKQPEGCLSMPGLEEVVQRPWAVHVKAKDLDGKPIEVAADDLLSRALQHEIDHLDGVLFSDRVSPLKRTMLMKKWKKLQAEGDI